MVPPPGGPPERPGPKLPLKFAMLVNTTLLMVELVDPTT